MNAGALRRQLPSAVAAVAVALVLGLGVASRPSAVVGDLATPADWPRLTTQTGEISFAVPPDWGTVVEGRPGITGSVLEAAQAADAADEYGIVGLLLDSGTSSAAHVKTFGSLSEDLGVSEDQSLDGAIGSVMLWSRRGLDSVFTEQGCAEGATRPFVGVGLRGVARRYRGCHGTEQSVLHVLAVDRDRRVAVNAWFLAPRTLDEPLLDVVLGSLRVDASRAP